MPRCMQNKEKTSVLTFTSFYFSSKGCSPHFPWWSIPSSLGTGHWVPQNTLCPVGMVAFLMPPWRGMALPSGQGWQHHWPRTAYPEGAQPQQQLRSPRGILEGILEPYQVWVHPWVPARLPSGLGAEHSAGSRRA